MSQSGHPQIHHPCKPYQTPLYEPICGDCRGNQIVKPRVCPLCRNRGVVPERRYDMKLNELSDNVGATKRRKRIARGPGSGTGKMAGRGIKGQKARSGVAINGYEGGQMPLYMRLPKRGFNNINAKTHAVVNLGLLQKFIDAKKLDAKKPITEEVLVESGLVRRVKDGVRILAKGTLTSKIDLTVTGASKSAVEAVEKAGGKLTVAAAKEVTPAAE